MGGLVERRLSKRTLYCGRRFFKRCLHSGRSCSFFLPLLCSVNLCIFDKARSNVFWPALSYSRFAALEMFVLKCLSSRNDQSLISSSDAMCSVALRWKLPNACFLMELIISPERASRHRRGNARTLRSVSSFNRCSLRYWLRSGCCNFVARLFSSFPDTRVKICCMKVLPTMSGLEGSYSASMFRQTETRCRRIPRGLASLSVCWRRASLPGTSSRTQASMEDVTDRIRASLFLIPRTPAPLSGSFFVCMFEEFSSSSSSVLSDASEVFRFRLRSGLWSSLFLLTPSCLTMKLKVVRVGCGSYFPLFCVHIGLCANVIGRIRPA